MCKLEQASPLATQVGLEQMLDGKVFFTRGACEKERAMA